MTLVLGGLLKEKLNNLTNKTENLMRNKNFTSKRLMFVEPVNKNSDVEELLERLILKLETMGVNVIDKEEENKDEN